MSEADAGQPSLFDADAGEPPTSTGVAAAAPMPLRARRRAAPPTRTAARVRHRSARERRARGVGRHRQDLGARAALPEPARRRRRSRQHPGDDVHAQGRGRDARAHHRRAARPRRRPATRRGRAGCGCAIASATSRSARSTPSATACCASSRSRPGSIRAFALAEETEAARLVDEALDQALRVCRRIARDDPHVALVLARLPPPRLRDEPRAPARSAARRPRGARSLSAGRARRPRPRARARTRRADAASARCAACAAGSRAFLADGPIAHPRYAMLAVRSARARARRGRPTPAALAAIVDEVRAYFLTQDGRPRTRVQRLQEGRRDLGRGRGSGTRRRWPRSRRRCTARCRRAARDLNVVLARGVQRVFAVTLRSIAGRSPSTTCSTFPS